LADSERGVSQAPSWPFTSSTCHLPYLHMLPPTRIPARPLHPHHLPRLSNSTSSLATNLALSPSFDSRRQPASPVLSRLRVAQHESTCLYRVERSTRGRDGSLSGVRRGIEMQVRRFPPALSSLVFSDRSTNKNPLVVFRSHGTLHNTRQPLRLHRRGRSPPRQVPDFRPCPSLLSHPLLFFSAGLTSLSLLDRTKRKPLFLERILNRLIRQENQALW
jgi:hypothetical protein